MSRRTNGVLPMPSSQTSETGKGRGSSDNAQSRSGRGKGSSEKQGEGSQAKNGNEKETTSKSSRSKAHNEGEKLVVRRLPPGMTEAEFVPILGSEWELGKGKVDWFSYAPGKISNDPSRPSRPSRAYLHIAKKDSIMALSEAVRSATWEDAKGSFNSPSLVGPPSVEFSIYKKVPSSKKRTDARQGTIDQDPEFMAFLESLANPAPPSQGIDVDDKDDATKAEAKVTTTPLIEYLKEKKANKGKESTSGKGTRHGRQESSAKGKSGKDEESSKKKGKESRGEKSDKPKETVKILTKKAATEQAVEAAKNAAEQSKSSTSQDAPKSRRAGIAAAARLLQRDLGLSPGSAHRKARHDAAKTDTDTKPTTTTKETPTTTSERPASPAQPAEAANPSSKGRSSASATAKTQSSNTSRRGRGKTGEKAEKGKATSGPSSQAPTAANPPVVLLKKKGTGNIEARPTTPAAAASSSAGTAQSSKETPANQASGSKSATSNQKGANKPGSSQKKSATVSANATRGFVKHANPSQGITEALLKQALEIHGTITFVEIDKRKGFAYVDFAEHEGLVKAVSASPVSVAQGTVQVLERKDKKGGNSTTSNSNNNATPASGAGAGPSAASAPASGSGSSEKPSGRGRRGRGGGGGGGGKTNANASSNN